jgi:hypothetical protein
MGANAQTIVPTFTASQVLTADQMNQSARTGVPVFASTVTRDAAFGGAGEKTLAEGQMCYVEGTGLQTYNAAGAWVTWGTNNGLVLVSTTTIGSAVSSVTVSGAFSATYDNYKIIGVGGTQSSGGGLALTLGSAATAYYYSLIYVDYAAPAVASPLRAQNTTSFLFAGSAHAGISLNCDVLNPFDTKNTMFRATIAQNKTDGFSGYSGGYLADTTSYTAFTLTISAGTMTGGKIYVYGYNN